MDDLLRQLTESSQGPTIEGLFLGGFAHADDIRTLGSNINTVENQAKMVEDFTQQHGLKINAGKTEVVALQEILDVLLKIPC